VPNWHDRAGHAVPFTMAESISRRSTDLSYISTGAPLLSTAPD
jgi:hypothetical protein